MANLIEKITNAKFNRRQFLKGSAAATAIVASLGASAYADSEMKETDTTASV